MAHERPSSSPCGNGGSQRRVRKPWPGERGPTARAHVSSGLVSYQQPPSEGPRFVLRGPPGARGSEPRHEAGLLSGFPCWPGHAELGTTPFALCPPMPPGAASLWLGLPGAYSSRGPTFCLADERRLVRASFGGKVSLFATGAQGYARRASGRISIAFVGPSVDEMGFRIIFKKSDFLRETASRSRWPRLEPSTSDSRTVPL